MNLIVCLDDKNGMMFNKRRQSRDSRVVADIMSHLNGRLYIDSYSKILFPDGDDRIIIADEPEKAAGKGESCFVEKYRGIDAERIETLIIYKWNRIYPHDVSFDMDIKGNGFVLKATYDFVGTSHEKITKEVYKR